MEAAVITAVGIDVSKSKSTVAVRRPGGEIALRPFEVHHTNSDLKKLASTLKKLGGDIRIVMEHTSTYWRPIALTDQIFPGVNIAFDPNTKNANGHEKWVDFFLRYWHKDCVCQYSMEAFTESYRGWCKRKNYKFRTDTAHKIYLLAQEGVATLPKCESTKMLITQACKSLNAVCEAKQSTQLEMQRLAAMLPEYEVVMQMEGAGPITGPALMAEIGDVRRFKNKKALVAFAGIDAPPFQSGAFESKSRHVSKRGSPHLRRTIFIVSNIILTRSNPENAVYCFMDKKRSEGKHYYVYTVAGSAKFLRVYYARVTEFLRSQPSLDAC